MRTPIDNFDGYTFCPLVAYGRKTIIKDNGVEIPLSLTLATVEPSLVPRLLRARTSLAVAFSTGSMDTREGADIYTLFEDKTNYRYFLMALKEGYITDAEYSKQASVYESAINDMFKKGPWEANKVYGGILYNNLETSGYAQQACSLILRSDITPDTLLHLMQSSLRWLADKPAVLQMLEGMFAEPGHIVGHHQNLIDVLTTGK